MKDKERNTCNCPFCNTEIELSEKPFCEHCQTDIKVNFCKDCGKPDTELIKEDRFTFIHCLACGAKHSIRNKI